jgi:hypothetical protein
MPLKSAYLSAVRGAHAIRRLLRLVLATAVCASVLLMGVVSPARAEAAVSTLQPGQSLANDTSLWSPNGRFRLTMQKDGNLVAYGPTGAVWATGTNGPGRYLVMQSDGNAVIYAGGQALWWSGTHGLPGSRLVMQDDANVVVYGPSGHPWWSRSTGPIAPGCYGDYCSGQDPMRTGCADDAATTAAADLTGARLELRWSTRCKANWARYLQYPRGFYIENQPIALRAVQDTGYQQIKHYEMPPTDNSVTWSPMIYSRVRLVRAQVVFSCVGIGDCLQKAFLTGEMTAQTAWK